MTYYTMRQWPDAGQCPEPLRAIASNLLQTHVLIRKSIAGLSHEKLWSRPCNQMYSIGNVLMHACGTEHHWLEHFLAGRPLHRDRDLEFATEDGQTAEQLLAGLDKSEAIIREVLAGLDKDMDVTQPINDGMSAEFMLHYAAQHLAYHAGQILTLRRLFEPTFELS